MVAGPGLHGRRTDIRHSETCQQVVSSNFCHSTKHRSGSTRGGSTTVSDAAAASASTGAGQDQEEEEGKSQDGDKGEDDDAACPYCLDEFPAFTWRGSGRNRYLCCGKAVCDACHAKSAAACPFCQSEVAVSDAERIRRVGAHADLGRPWALLMLGDIHKMGIGTPMNPSFALECFRKAADVGYPMAQHSLGECYLLGIGTGRDVDEAAAWFERAAAAGFPAAKHSLACIVGGALGPSSSSSSVPTDPRREFRLLSEAAERGYPPAQEGLAQLYEYGTVGVPVSLDRALFWHRRAALRGIAASQNNLAGCYLKRAAESDGCVDPAMPIAMFWSRQAAATGDDADAARIFREMQSMTANKCSLCGASGSGLLPSPLLRCSRCREALYCCAEHQKKHWKLHKPACGEVKAAREEYEQAQEEPTSYQY